MFLIFLIPFIIITIFLLFMIVLGIIRTKERKTYEHCLNK